MTLTGIDIGIVGIGNMGTAMAQGWMRAVRSGREGPARIHVYDPRQERVQALCRAGGDTVEAAETIQDLADRASFIVVSVKPQDIEDPLEDLSDRVGADTVVVSTAAGARMDRLREALGPGPRLFRVMPNLAVAVGEGVLAVAAEEGTPGSVVEQVTAALDPLGLVEVIKEDYLDVITAVTGSGPGFLALVLEGIEDGAVQAGLPRDIARPFVRQTALGAARVLEDEDLSPAELKDRVASPGGTTIAGLAVLEEEAVRGALIMAVEAAARRGRGL